MSDQQAKLIHDMNLSYHATNAMTNRVGSQSSMRPNSLHLNGSRLNPIELITPRDYDKLLLSTPELEAQARGYTTPELLNALSTPIISDEQPLTGNKILEDMINVHHGRPAMFPTQPIPITENVRHMYPSNPMFNHHLAPQPNSFPDSSIPSSYHDNDSSNSASTLSPFSTQLGSNQLPDDLQNVPSQRRSTPTEGNDHLRKEKKRERNRQAAQKCRTRKLNRIAELQQRVNQLQDKNKDLTVFAEALKKEVTQLEKQLEDHRVQGCPMMSNTFIG